MGTLPILSGFRTPWFNRSTGNTTDYSRHLWGDAADVFIDRDGDGDGDDLDGNGRSTLLDAHVLAGVVDELGARPSEGFMVGGMSVYRRNAAHGASRPDPPNEAGFVDAGLGSWRRAEAVGCAP